MKVEKKLKLKLRINARHFTSLSGSITTFNADMIKQKSQDTIGFFLVVGDDALGVHGIDVCLKELALINRQAKRSLVYNRGGKGKGK
jgi:hypothetical protein